MIPELKILFNLNDIVLILWIIISKLLKNLNLYHTLIMQPFLISNNLHAYVFLIPVVITFKSITKWAFSQFRNYFESISNMISKFKLVFSCFIIKVVIPCSSWWFHPVWHFPVQNRKEIYVRVILYLLNFKRMNILL